MIPQELVRAGNPKGMHGRRGAVLAAVLPISVVLATVGGWVLAASGKRGYLAASAIW
jgi:hypothetical protein